VIRGEVKCFGYSDISETNELRSIDASVDFSPMNGEGSTWNSLVLSMFVVTVARWFSRVAVRPRSLDAAHYKVALHAN